MYCAGLDTLCRHTELCRRIQHVTFVPGIQFDTFQWITTKCAAMTEQEKGLCIDAG